MQLQVKYDDHVLLQHYYSGKMLTVQNEEGEQSMDFFPSQSTGFFVRLMILHHVFSCYVSL